MHGGEFIFNPRMHEPGAQTVLGRSLSGYRLRAGPRGARRSGRAIRPPPSTSPPSSCAISLPTSRRRRWSSGWPNVFATLKAISRRWRRRWSPRPRPGTRRAASSSGRASGSSSALRATGVTPPDIRPVLQAHNLLGEPLWRPSAPKGFADDSAAWLDGIAQRIDVANQLAAPCRRPSRSEGGVRPGAGAARLGRDAADYHPRREPAAGLGAAADGARVSEEMTMRLHAPRAASYCSPPARCSPGPICRRSRAPKAATRACW